MTPPKWTPAEDVIIIANRAAGMSSLEVSALLPGRTVGACKDRAYRLRKAHKKETEGRPWDEIEAEIITALKTHSIKNVMHIMRRRYGDRVKIARIVKIYREQVATGVIESRAIKSRNGRIDARRIVDQASACRELHRRHLASGFHWISDPAKMREAEAILTAAA